MRKAMDCMSDENNSTPKLAEKPFLGEKLAEDVFFGICIESTKYIIKEHDVFFRIQSPS